MSADLTASGRALVASPPLIAAVADDELTSRRIEGVLAADGMIVETRGLSVEDLGHGSAVDPDVLVVAFGRGITERDAQMRRLRKSLPDTHLIAIMPEDSRRGVRRALEAGADGVVFETQVETALTWTVRAVMAGQTTVPAAGRHEVDRPTLSGREKQVLGMVVMGLSNKAIASKLFLAESTVKCHLSSAFSKLGVRSRNEAADLILHSGAGFGLGLISPPAYAPTEGSEQMNSVHTHLTDGAGS
ncbi:MAG TPA: response regulator transcription factor [Solirubrobacteraceae bacterium]|nr:response regulator transcription factor [Solirubrobacteraceae bacterium]